VRDRREVVPRLHRECLSVRVSLVRREVEDGRLLLSGREGADPVSRVVKYLVTGQAGSGKSSIARELVRRGVTAYDTDSIPEACGFDYADTGLPVPWSELTHPIDFRRIHWNWRLDVLDELLDSADDVFVCAIASNTVAQRHRFDRVFVLQLDDETLARRLRERTEHTFGKDPREAAAVIAHNRVIADEWRARGAIVIDAARPLTDVVDDIVARMSA
jgi:gluconate kinase